MGYSPEHKQKTRERILECAGRLFKENGYDATGVDEVMAEAGLTRGGFYAHFKSKDDLFAHVIEPPAFSKQALAEDVPPNVKITAIVNAYLSGEHRDRPGDGCPLPALGNDAKLRGGAAQRRYARLLKGLSLALARELSARGTEEAEQRSQAMTTLLVGGVSLARVMGRGAASEEFLTACRKSALELADLEGS